MTADVIHFPDRPRREQLDELRQLVESLPLSFHNEHCKAARTMLGWSIELSPTDQRYHRRLSLESRKAKRCARSPCKK